MKQIEIQLGYTYFEGRQAVDYRRLPVETVEEAKALLDAEGTDTRLMIISIS